MKHSNKKKWIYGLVVLAIIAIVSGWMIKNNQISHTTHLVRRGNFDKYITTKGEIQGKEAFLITISDIFKDNTIQIWDLKIKDMVPEGTIVKKGDWVATLDQASINQRIQTNREEIDRRLAWLNDAKIDSAISLTRLRQQLQELGFDLQYRQLELDQAQYESPAYQRRTQTAFNQKIRQIERAKRDYELRRMDLANRIRRYEQQYDYAVTVDEKLQQALEACSITAPQAGMVVYTRWRGYRKIRIGDDVGPHRPVIASLPDLSVLVSETFVEEIDIAKIANGDSAIITVDAVPGVQFRGIILRIANVAQNIQGTDSKVFPVVIELAKSERKLLPGMTSTNQIILERIPNQITIPRTSLFSEDGNSFVYLKKGGKVWKKIVEPGSENDEVIVILGGLEERDRILLQPVEKPEEISYITE